MGFVGLIPRRRNCWRKTWLSYPLSAINPQGRVRGRPRRWGTLIVANVDSASVCSCDRALATCSPIGSPWPSATTITFEPLPILVLPTPEPPFSPARSCHRGTLAPTPACSGHPGGSGVPARCAPRYQQPTTAAGGASTSQASHTRAAGLPKGSRNAPFEFQPLSGRASDNRMPREVFCRFVSMHFPMKKQQQAHVQLGVSSQRGGDVQPNQPRHQDGQIDLTDDRFHKGKCPGWMGERRNIPIADRT
jgi:hypothetical protein